MYRAPENAIDIYVVGKQWMWKVQHPEGKREINELHVPVNQPVRLTLASEDVIHAFSVPAFRIKRDVVPGRYNTWVLLGDGYAVCRQSQWGASPARKR